MKNIVYDRGYLKTLSDYIEQTFWSEIEKYPQINEHYKQKIDVRFLSDTDRLWEHRFERHKGHFTRKYVRESFSSKLSFSFETMCFYECIRDDGICHIYRMYLNVNMEQLLTNMFSRISTLDTQTEDHIKHMIKISVRHEVGHILDWINDVDNKHMDHVNNKKKINTSTLNEFYSIMDTLSDEELHIRYYSQIPDERSANELVGLTPQDFLFKSEKEN